MPSLPNSIDTVFALASAPGRAAIAVWRLSGPDTANALRALTGFAPPPPRRAALRFLADPASGQPIDQAIVLWFPAPASFTGEDCAELQCHGGRALGEAVAAALGRLPGLRPAEPGEFSRRAFQNGKLDLTSAEAIADLTAAETEAQRVQALSQASGALRQLYDGWRSELIRLRARLEAAMEFPEDDIGDAAGALMRDVATLREAVRRHLADARRGERVRDGLKIAVVGAPNAGKSSLVNALTGRDIAIVSPEAGTTRDAIEAHLDLGGYAVTVVDTAGLRVTSAEVEAEGVARARAHAESADLVIAVFARGAALDDETVALIDARTVVVENKADLAAGVLGVAHADVRLSALTGEGIDGLVGVLTERAANLVSTQGSAPPTRARHREWLARCVAALDAATTGIAPELAAEELRLGADALGRITGRIDVEEVLDRVFAEFCVGK